MTPRRGRHTEYRGRPKGKSKSFFTDLESIALIAWKHDLDPERLANAFFNALQHKTAHCGGLTICCRETHNDTGTFLVEKDEKTIWQAPIHLECIRNPGVREYLKNIPIPDYVAKKKDPVTQKIGDLRFGMKRINVIANISDIPPAIVVNTRWGTTASVSNVTIVDETGSIQLSLWNDQISKVHVGDMVELKNCYVARYAGAPQVRLGRKGTISIINEHHQEKPNPL